MVVIGEKWSGGWDGVGGNSRDHAAGATAVEPPRCWAPHARLCSGGASQMRGMLATPADRTGPASGILHQPQRRSLPALLHPCNGRGRCLAGPVAHQANQRPHPPIQLRQLAQQGRPGQRRAAAHTHVAGQARGGVGEPEQRVVCPRDALHAPLAHARTVQLLGSVLQRAEGAGGHRMGCA